MTLTTLNIIYTHVHLSHLLSSRLIIKGSQCSGKLLILMDLLLQLKKIKI